MVRCPDVEIEGISKQNLPPWHSAPNEGTLLQPPRDKREAGASNPTPNSVLHIESLRLEYFGGGWIFLEERLKNIVASAK